MNGFTAATGPDHTFTPNLSPEMDWNRSVIPVEYTIVIIFSPSEQV